MNDKAYEQELNTLQQEMLLVLDELHNDLGSWNNRDILAAQRALQVLIESLIGLARYVYQNRYGITVSKSRSAIDGLHNKRDLSETDFQLAIRMVGFRNVLVHDYLDLTLPAPIGARVLNRSRTFLFHSSLPEEQLGYRIKVPVVRTFTVMNQPKLSRSHTNSTDLTSRLPDGRSTRDYRKIAAYEQTLKRSAPHAPVSYHRPIGRCFTTGWVNRAILEAIVRKQLYQDVRRIARDLFVLVNAKPASGQP